MHHFYNVLKRNFCLSLHFPPVSASLREQLPSPGWCGAKPCLWTRVAQAVCCLLAPQSPCSRNESLWETICLSCYTYWQLKCSLSHFRAICWKMIHGVSPSCGLSTTALAGEAPSPQSRAQAPRALSCASGQPRDRVAASRAAPAAPERLLLPRTRWPNPPLSQK